MNRDEHKLDLIRLRVAGGYYNRPEAIESAARAVVNSQTLRLLLDRYDNFRRFEASLARETRLARFQDIRQKISDGYYDDPNLLADLAERIIKRMGLE